ncbi:MAG: putative endonuclease [Yoonia sp.]|jgi:putative endonuclease
MTALTSLKNYYAGLAAEAIVANDYMRRGKGGEIDLIVRDGDALVFVEVKKSKTHDQALRRVSRRQMDRLCATASEFVANEPRGLLTEMRFDVATIDQSGTVRIVENAFMEA